MKKISKRMKELKKLKVKNLYNIEEAIDIIKKTHKTKFEESIDVSIKLGIDSRKANQIIKGHSQLTHGSGKNIKIAIFAEKEEAKIAKIAGAEIIGMEDLLAEIKLKKIKFDVLLTSHNTLYMTKGLNKILGPKGLMPNEKNGTITNNIKKTIFNIKNRLINYKNDKNGIIHCSIGRINFTNEQLKENFMILIKDLKKIKPSSSKGNYFKKITLSSTMGISTILDINSIEM